MDSEFEFTEHQDDSVVPEQIVNTPAGANTDLDSNNNFAGHSCNDDVIHELSMNLSTTVIWTGNIYCTDIPEEHVGAPYLLQLGQKQFGVVECFL